jgi:hypothetical protein
MNESVYVEYELVRDVYVDKQLCGKTNQLMTVQTGTHAFDLGLPPDYRPPGVIETVINTTPLNPLVIHFDRQP